MLEKIWQYPVAPFKVFGNLYFVGISPASTHIIDTGSGLILIDPGYAETLYIVLESIRKLGFDIDVKNYVAVNNTLEYIDTDTISLSKNLYKLKNR